MKTKSVLALIGTLLLFSTFEIVSKMIIHQVPPLQINFLRFLIGGLVLLPFALFFSPGEKKRTGGKDFLELFKVGFIMVTVSVTLLQVAILFIPASAAAVIFCTNPLFAYIYEAYIKHEAISRRTGEGLLLSLAGLFIIIVSRLVGNDVGMNQLEGMMLAFISAGFFGVYIVTAKGVAERVGSLKANAFSFILGALSMVPVLLWFKVPLFRFDPSCWPHMLYLSVGVSALAYVLFLYALRHMPAAVGSLIFFAKPVVASFLAYIMLRETITVPFAIGTAGIVVGLFLVTAGEKKV